MAGNSTQSTIPAGGSGEATVSTGNENELILQRTRLLVLEMEDVLFHLDSAVMMPEAPGGSSSSDGSEDDHQDPSDQQTQQMQEQATGLRALALVFCQFELDPRKRLLLLGHTDTSGGAQMNFGLSEQRALSVLHLLTGNRQEWADNSASRHKVEDYQQILKYLALTKGWDCDPDKIDDIWGDKTERASRNFFTRADPANAESLISTVRANIQKKWPADAWALVYDQYEQVLAETLGVAVNAMSTPRGRVRYAYPDKQYLACGESFPVDDAQRNNYRSQRNRRVEILFLDEDEVPAEINCPQITSRAHTADECPLRDIDRFAWSYLDPNDVFAVAYHFKFRYFDRIKKQLTDVPDGLRIRAYKRDGTEVPTRQTFDDGLYAVVAQFPSNEEAQANRSTLHFRFETSGAWIYTANADESTLPVIVRELPRDRYDALGENERSGHVCFDGMSMLDKLKYYDLPALWDSRNWRCAVGNNVNDFEHHMTTATTPSQPIRFMLDDIVLLDTSGNQAVMDRNSEVTSTHLNGQPHPLSNRSRVRILFADPEDTKLKIYSTNPSGTAQQRHDGSIIRFQTNAAGAYRNYIKDPPGGARAIVFCGQFYDVTFKRTVANAHYNVVNGHVLGARAAVLNDSDVHHMEAFQHDSNNPPAHCSTIGHFDVHYLHGGGFDDSRWYSYLIIYWSTFVAKDTQPTVGGTGDNRPATDTEVNECKSIGMENSMEHWNKKDYRCDDHSGSSNHSVRPLFMFEAFEEFSYTPPSPVNFRSNFNDILTSGHFQTARRNSRGGVPKTITFVVEEKKGSWMRSWRSSAASFSVMSLRIKTRKNDPTRFSGFPFTEFGDPGQYGCLVMAHEIGHATGQVDDYCQDITEPKTFGYLPTLGQFGFTATGDFIANDNNNFGSRVQGSEAYEIRHDAKTMMTKNGPVRMRQIWRFVHWLNNLGRSGQPLHAFTNGVQFEINYPRASMRFYRSLSEKVDPWHFALSGTIDVAPDKTMNVYLFKRTDETRRGRRSSGTNVDYKAILCLRLLLSITYVNTGLFSTWSDRNKKDWNNALNSLFNANSLRGKYLLSGGGGDLDPTIIRIIPGFYLPTGSTVPSQNSYNYHLRVRRRSDDAISQSGTTLTLGDRISARELLNFFFNKSAADTSFATTDFNFVKNWFSLPTIGNGAFNIEQV
ncbi:MAG: hypothetical protein GF401_02520 [Chitinivibrionales bacterium]|nr:hypothetical protein [Chitinivibrionales bacterium]